jgi:peptidoglycan/xylan/chitin deacetylase (PgdA/CDA1 family)
MINSASIGEKQLRYIRAVAYHNVDKTMVTSFRRQLEYYKRCYDNINENDLELFFSRIDLKKSAIETKKNEKRQGIIISFDDGLLNHYTVVAPLLEEFGFRGWFFIPAAMPRLSVEEQKNFCLENHLLILTESNDRIGMNTEEIIDLQSRGHIIGCHTMNHRRFNGYIDTPLAEKEIREAKQELTSMINVSINSFAWVGGEPETYNAVAQRVLKKEGFKFSFTTLSNKIDNNSDPLLLHRTVLDADMPYPVFRAKLSGLSDIRHYSSRRTIEKRLAIA